MKGLLQEMANRFWAKCCYSGISSIRRCALFAGLLALILVPRSFGQGLTGSISGTVTDSSGAPISGATVTVRQVDTNAIRTITTSDVGTYKLTQLVPGVYSARIEKEGFTVFEQGNITLAIDQVVQIDVRLNVGSEMQTINVTAEVPVLQSENSSVGLVVDSPTIQNTPLNGHLSILGLLNLVPGVQDVAAQDQVPVRGVTLAFGTNQRNSYGDVGFTFDGVSNMEVMLQRGEGEVPPLDTLSQFKVITSGAPAEFNQPNQVIIVSQGGANQVHGEVLEFNRGKGTSAKQYFGGSQPRPPYERNEYGGNLSGPIYIPKLYNGKDRSFFAFGYEGFHLTQSVSLTSQQPTALMREGNFTEFSTPIINPATGQSFPGNIIPQSMFNQVDVQLQNLLYPLPTAPGTGVNTFELVPHTTDVNRYFFRIDHRINDNNQIRFSFLRALYGPFSDVASQGSGSSKAGGVARDGEHNTIFVLGWTHTFSPTMLLDAYVSYLHLPLFRDAQNYKTDFSAIIPGLGPQLLQGAPQLTITNITPVGEAGSKNLEQTYQANVALTKVLSKHTIKTGFSYLYDNGWQDNAQSPARGAYNFNGRYTGNAYADFLLGFPNSTGQATPGDFVTRYLSSQYGMYMQDDFKLIPRLTLNYGIRYDLQWFGDNPYGAASLFVPSVGKVVVFAKSYPAATIQAFIPDTALAPQVGLPTHVYDYLGQATTNVAPRFGFAYQVVPNTVIRGAAGLFYNLMPSSYIDGAFGNLPFVSSISYSQQAASFPQITMNAPFAGTGAYGANPSVIAQHSTTTPYTEQYNLAIEHQFGKGLDMRIGYVGQRTIHQNNFGGPGNTQRDINLPPPAPGVVQNRRPFQPFSTISENFSPIFHTTGNSLQIGIHKQYSHGFMINAEYQWIRVLGVENFENPANIGDSYGNISNITPQTLEVSYAYALPFGRRQMLFRSSAAVVDKIVSGWQIAGITSFQSGQPFSVTYTAPGNPVGLVSGRANRVPGVALYPIHKTLNEWFNPAAFTAPPNFTYGTSGYNMLWGPHYQNWDMNLMKNISWKERYNLQIRADAFNVFNHPNFSVPGAAVSNPSSIGRITSQVNENRTMEFAAKFSF
jgi:Carboxypeptidase regulatory-like domain/TonB dependent receptor